MRRMMYHPLLDGVVDKGDVDVDNLQPYTELIGEAQFGPVMKNILKSISLYFHVCLSTFTPQTSILHINHFFITFKSITMGMWELFSLNVGNILWKDVSPTE